MCRTVQETFTERAKMLKAWKDAEALLERKKDARARLEAAHRMDKLPAAEKEIHEVLFRCTRSHLLIMPTEHPFPSALEGDRTNHTFSIENKFSRTDLYRIFWVEFFLIFFSEIRNLDGGWISSSIFLKFVFRNSFLKPTFAGILSNMDSNIECLRKHSGGTSTGSMHCVGGGEG